MSCTDLALTGGPAVLQLVGALALLLIGLGVVLVLRRRRRAGAHHRIRAAIAITLLVILGGAVTGISTSLEPAQAAGACSLSIAQTSTISGLEPGRAPDAITGLVTNNGSDHTVIVAIVVSIASVTPAPGAPAGPCDASDFLLRDPRMAVGITLAPGGSTVFGGASIGFRDGPTNQNACKGSTVQLAYTTVP